MASLSGDSRYRALAASAAASLGASSPEIQKAILAQWQCEQPGGPPWPPVHNNPGFVTAGAMKSVGLPARAASRSPGRGFLAEFDSPEAGASAYAGLLARGRRYAATRQAAARGDGLGFLRAVTSAGYGTRFGCASSAYRAIAGRDRDPLGTATPASSAVSGDKLWPASQLFRTALGVNDDHIVTATDVDRVLTWYEAQLRAGPSGPPPAKFMTGLRRLFTGWIGARVGDLKLKVQNPSTTSPGIEDTVPNLINPIADALAGLAEQLKDVFGRTLLIAAILGLAIIGLVMIFRGGGSDA